MLKDQLNQYQLNIFHFIFNFKTFSTSSQQYKKFNFCKRNNYS